MKEGARTAAAVGSVGAGVSGTVVATAAGACCAGPAISPLIVGVMGAGGAAWAAGLKPYSPYLLAVSGVLLGGALWNLRPSAETCDTNGLAGGAAVRRVRSAARIVTWAAAALWLAAVVLNLAVS